MAKTIVKRLFGHRLDTCIILLVRGSGFVALKIVEIDVAQYQRSIILFISLSGSSLTQRVCCALLEGRGGKKSEKIEATNRTDRRPLAIVCRAAFERMLWGGEHLAADLTLTNLRLRPVYSMYDSKWVQKMCKCSANLPGTPNPLFLYCKQPKVD